MGNECCRVNNYIDEDEELRIPMESIYPSTIEKIIHVNKYAETVPEENENEPKDYSRGECIIIDQPSECTSCSKNYCRSNDNNSLDIVSQSNDNNNLDIVSQSNDNNSLDIVSQSNDNNSLDIVSQSNDNNSLDIVSQSNDNNSLDIVSQLSIISVD